MVEEGKKISPLKSCSNAVVNAFEGGFYRYVECIRNSVTVVNVVSLSQFILENKLSKICQTLEVNLKAVFFNILYFAFTNLLVILSAVTKLVYFNGCL